MNEKEVPEHDEFAEEAKAYLEPQKKVKIREKLRLFFQALSRMPYKWAWVALMVCSTVLFSWWDDIIVWTAGVAWNWLIIPLYYFAEYCILLPLTLLLAKKTYQKLNLNIQLRQVIVQSLKNSLPMLIYRKLRKRGDRK